MNPTNKNQTETPKKQYYSISEVAVLTGLEQHVLRYWESEFSKLRPRKNRAGNRQYREKDIQIIRYIKHLLQEEMYTVQGAKKKLRDSGYKEFSGQMNLLSPIISKQRVMVAQPLSGNPRTSALNSSNGEGVNRKKLVDKIRDDLKKELESILRILK